MMKFVDIYRSGKRLVDRARWNDVTGRFELLHRSSREEHAVPLPGAFVDSVTSHIERALALGYVEHVFFPDMGHAHLLIPQSYYDATISAIPPTRLHEVYTRVLARPDTRFLHHTAEQLSMLDDRRAVLPERYLGWRHFTRNLVGRNDRLGALDIHANLKSVGNTVRDVPGGYRYRGAGFHVSASEDGCFTYMHERATYRYDISLSDLPPSFEHDGQLAGIDENGDARHGGTVGALWGPLPLPE